MKYLYLLLSACVFTACGLSSAHPKKPVKAKPAHVLPAFYKNAAAPGKAKTDTVYEGQTDAYATYYVIVADTGRNYDELKTKMFALHEATNLLIDTMGRSYNKAKDLIALPDDDEDDIVAGDYYPRRYVSSTLSLEYLTTYIEDANPKTIALIAGIYETKASAESALKAMGHVEAHTLKARIYEGCLH